MWILLYYVFIELRKDHYWEKSMFYNRLNTLVKISGKSMNYIEKELNYLKNSLNNYKNFRMSSAIRVFELAQYFGVSPEYMIGLTETRTRCNSIFFRSSVLKVKFKCIKVQLNGWWKKGILKNIDLILSQNSPYKYTLFMYTSN